MENTFFKSFNFFQSAYTYLRLAYKNYITSIFTIEHYLHIYKNNL